MEGLSRWNAARAAAAVQDNRQLSGGELRSFDVLLQHRCNQLALDTGLQPVFSGYQRPADHTGKYQLSFIVTGMVNQPIEGNDLGLEEPAIAKYHSSIH